MRIALHDGFGGLRHTAEREFASRCVTVLENMGHEPKIAALSDEIVEFAPDFVLATHELVPKLTEYFTVGVLWSPRFFMRDDPERHRSIRSWDLAVTANAGLRQFAEDLYFPLRHKSAIADGVIFPTAPVIPDLKSVDPRYLSLAYVGVHWDGGRHKDLLLALSRLVDLNVYGPASAWTFLPNHYRGVIPFDGNSLFATLNKHGAVLALHKDTHLGDDTPSMRPFEACAARCLVITDPMPTLQALFGETLHYVDAAADPESAASTIRDILQEARAKPEKTSAQIRRAHDIFAARASLDELLAKLVEEVALKIAVARAPALAARPAVTMIVRCGGASFDTLRETIDALQKQTFRDICLVLSGATNRDDLASYVDSVKVAERFREIAFVEVKNYTSSAALWAGLATVCTEYVSVLDPTDRLFPDHLHHVMDLFVDEPDLDVVFTSAIGHVGNGLHAEQPARLKLSDGDPVYEDRFLINQSLDDPAQLLGKDPIAACSFVFRRGKLPSYALDDPHLDAFEIDYLLLMLLSAGARFRCASRVSAQTKVGTGERPNDLAHRSHVGSIARIHHRLETLALASGSKANSLVAQRHGTAVIAAASTATATESDRPINETSDQTVDRRRTRLRWLRLLRGGDTRL